MLYRRSKSERRTCEIVRTSGSEQRFANAECSRVSSRAGPTLGPQSSWIWGRRRRRWRRHGGRLACWAGRAGRRARRLRDRRHGRRARRLNARRQIEEEELERLTLGRGLVHLATTRERIGGARLVATGRADAVLDVDVGEHDLAALVRFGRADRRVEAEVLAGPA